MKKKEKKNYCRAIEHVEVPLDDVMRVFIKERGIRIKRADIIRAEWFLDVGKGVVLFRCYVEPRETKKG